MFAPLKEMKIRTIKVQIGSQLASLLHNNSLIDSYLYSELNSRIIVTLDVIYHILHHQRAIEVEGRVMKGHFISGPFSLTSWRRMSKRGFEPD